jgi:hypothetical protein
MKCEKSRTIYRCIKLIEDGEEIPYALRNLANKHGINIEQLKEVLQDVNEKEGEYINSESGEDREYSDGWFRYPEAYT